MRRLSVRPGVFLEQTAILQGLLREEAKRETADSEESAVSFWASELFQTTTPDGITPVALIPT